MDIAIDLESDTPIFAQLMDQVKQAVLQERLQPGAGLPSIRQIANDLEINNKTVAKAYRLLERDNVIQTKGYRGTFVHPEAKKNCGVDLNQLTTSTLADAISKLRHEGITDSEIRIAFQNIMNSKAY